MPYQLLLLLALQASLACLPHSSSRFVPEPEVEFGFGVAVSAEELENARYLELIQKEFNSITPENSMKLDTVSREQGVQNFEPSDRIAEFARLNKLNLRGHPLVWHRQNPAWLSSLDAVQLEQFLERHIGSMLERYGTQVDSWDVVNEAILQAGVFRQSVWHKMLGAEYIELAYRYAAKHGKRSLLFYNDFDLAYNQKKFRAVLWLIDSLVEFGLRVDGLGFQMHLRPSAMPTAEQIEEAFRQVSAKGYWFEVTELDVAIELPLDEEKLKQQASKVCEVIRLCKKYYKCRGVSIWGLSDGHSWIPEILPGLGAATLFDKDYNPKPSYFAAKKALSGQNCN